MANTKPRLTPEVFEKMQASISPELKRKMDNCIKSESEERVASASIRATHVLCHRTEWNQLLIDMRKFGDEMEKLFFIPIKRKRKNKRKSLGPNKGRN